MVGCNATVWIRQAWRAVLGLIAMMMNPWNPTILLPFHTECAIIKGGVGLAAPRLALAALTDSESLRKSTHSL